MNHNDLHSLAIDVSSGEIHPYNDASILDSKDSFLSVCSNILLLYHPCSCCRARGCTRPEEISLCIWRDAYRQEQAMPPLQTAAKMCIKTATVVTCKRDEALSLPHYEIECCDKPGTYKVIKCTAAAITETQDKLLGVRGGTTGDDNRIISDKSIQVASHKSTCLKVPACAPI